MAFGINRGPKEPEYGPGRKYCGYCIDLGVSSPCDSTGRFPCNCSRFKGEGLRCLPEDTPHVEGGYTKKCCLTPGGDATTAMKISKKKRGFYITTIVYDLLMFSIQAIDILNQEREYLCTLQNDYISTKYPDVWAQYSYIGYLVAQYIKALPAEQALNIAKRIHDEYFVDIINNPAYTMEDKCLKYIEMYEDMKRYFGIDAAMEGLLYDDNTLPIPVDPSSFMQSSEEQPVTTIVAIHPTLTLEPLAKQKS